VIKFYQFRLREIARLSTNILKHKLQMKCMIIRMHNNSFRGNAKQALLCGQNIVLVFFLGFICEAVADVTCFVGQYLT